MNSNQKEEFRYQYAGMAMQSLIAHGHPDVHDPKGCAKRAVLFANALINELEKGDKQ